jgi:aconitate decarboxylase
MPKDGLQAKFSVYHGGAAGLVFGKAGPGQYADEVVTSQEVVSVRDRIDATADKSLNADEAEIIVELENENQLKKHVQHAVGSLEVPMTDQQLEEKFLDQVGLVLGLEGARKASETAWQLGNVKNVVESLKYL